MTLTPRRREALQAVKDGRVTHFTTGRAAPDFLLDGEPFDTEEMDLVEDAGLINVDYLAHVSPIRLTPSGESALEEK